MYKKHSNDIIEEFVDLGNNTFEFCFNIKQVEEKDNDNMFNINRISYVSDCILVEKLDSFDSIFEILMRDKYTVQNELNIMNEHIIYGGDDPDNEIKFKEYQQYRLLMKNKTNDFLNKKM